MADAAIEAAGSINSSYDRGLVLGELAATAPSPPDRAPHSWRRSALCRRLTSSGRCWRSWRDLARRCREAVAARRAPRPRVRSVPRTKRPKVLLDADLARPEFSRRNRGVVLRRGDDDQLVARSGAASFARLPNAPAFRRSSKRDCLRASASISSGHDRATVLLEILKAQTLSTAARQLFLDAAQGISSSYDQNRVLAELVRSERRE